VSFARPEPGEWQGCLAKAPPQCGNLHQLVSRTMNNEGNAVCRIACWHSSLMKFMAPAPKLICRRAKAKCPAHASLSSPPAAAWHFQHPLPKKVSVAGHAAHPRLRLQGVCYLLLCHSSPSAHGAASSKSTQACTPLQHPCEAPLGQPSQSLVQLAGPVGEGLLASKLSLQLAKAQGASSSRAVQPVRHAQAALLCGACS
jgi:hypothetical protein